MVDAEEFEDDLEDEEDDDYEIVRAKWCMDGAATLAEAAEMLRGFAQHLDVLALEGWQLTQPVKHDYGFIRQQVSTETSDA